MNFLSLPERTEKPRTFGLTSVVDFGVPIGELELLLHDHHSFIDIVKIGIGTAYVTPSLDDKLTLYKEYDIIPYFGGTLFEKSYAKGVLPEYIEYLKAHGIEWMEISNGVLDIPLEERLQLIEELKNTFHMIGEVGHKDHAKEIPIAEWIKETQALLDAGCEYVITEGRGSGTAGIYGKDGQVKMDIVTQLTNAVEISRMIFEAPTAKQQMFFINRFGTNVNLGNVDVRSALLLETQRRGLRSETFFLEEESCKPS
ncbi:MAG TPA: phosphosulfolactate synthase [Bacillales bacterium]|nr:phosphosulfolactate synthase [Bacillales bacterium]